VENAKVVKFALILMENVPMDVLKASTLQAASVPVMMDGLVMDAQSSVDIAMVVVVILMEFVQQDVMQDGMEISVTYH
jgi:hypothetical protein